MSESKTSKFREVTIEEYCRSLVNRILEDGEHNVDVEARFLSEHVEKIVSQALVKTAQNFLADYGNTEWSVSVARHIMSMNFGQKERTIETFDVTREFGKPKRLTKNGVRFGKRRWMPEDNKCKTVLSAKFCDLMEDLDIEDLEDMGDEDEEDGQKTGSSP